jgi:hypothetical protein
MYCQKVRVLFQKQSEKFILSSTFEEQDTENRKRKKPERSG